MGRRKGFKMQMTVHITPEAAGKVEEMASREDISITEVVERAIRAYFKIKDKK